MIEIERVDPAEASRLLGAEARGLLIDVRDPVEFAFVGHPVGAVNIPWKTAPQWQLNPHFVSRVQEETGGELDRPLFLLCRSGQRSLDAARALAQAGFRRIINIEQGFEGLLDSHKHRGNLGGWRHAGLPWEQS